MKSFPIHPEVKGTRTGYVIRYTCPTCIAENIIVNSSPRDHFNNRWFATCEHCRTRVAVLTPDW